MTTTLDIPNPLSEAVQAEAFRNGGGNVHEVAEMMALKSASPSALPPALRDARKRMDKAAEVLAEAQQALAEQNAARHEVGRLEAEVETKTRYLSNDQTRLANAQSSVANFAADWEERHPNEQRAGWSVVVQRIYDCVISEKLLEVMPAAIEKAEAELKEVQAQLAEMKKRYGV